MLPERSSMATVIESTPSGETSRDGGRTIGFVFSEQFVPGGAPEIRGPSLVEAARDVLGDLSADLPWHGIVHAGHVERLLIVERMAPRDGPAARLRCVKPVLDVVLL